MTVDRERYIKGEPVNDNSKARAEIARLSAKRAVKARLITKIDAGKTTFWEGTSGEQRDVTSTRRAELVADIEDLDLLIRSAEERLAGP